jgi:hypothetical protein
MLSKPTILRDEPPAMLDGGGVDKTVGRVAREGRRQRNRSRGHRRRGADSADLYGELLQPGADRNRHPYPVMFGKPCQFEPRDRRNGQLISDLDLPACSSAQPARLRRPPVHDVRIEQDRCQGKFQAASVV